jgi:uncharacterized protein (UPF0248 family)
MTLREKILKIAETNIYKDDVGEYAIFYIDKIEALFQSEMKKVIGEDEEEVQEAYEYGNGYSPEEIKDMNIRNKLKKEQRKKANL